MLIHTFLGGVLLMSSPSGGSLGDSETGGGGGLLIKICKNDWYDWTSV